MIALGISPRTLEFFYRLGQGLYFERCDKNTAHELSVGVHKLDRKNFGEYIWQQMPNIMITKIALLIFSDLE